MTKLFANPYDMAATGFYFESFDEYERLSAALVNSYGQPVEEFMIDYIDGPDAELFKACGIDQSNLELWFDEVEDLSDSEKAALFYLCSIHGQSVDEALEMRGGGVRNIDDVSLYHGTLEKAAEDLFDELYAHEIPEHLRSYIDYESFARDCRCGGDMYEFEFDGETWTCTSANS
jgi:hypothetical protein